MRSPRARGHVVDRHSPAFMMLRARVPVPSAIYSMAQLLSQRSLSSCLPSSHASPSSTAPSHKSAPAPHKRKQLQRLRRPTERPHHCGARTTIKTLWTELPLVQSIMCGIYSQVSNLLKYIVPCTEVQAAKPSCEPAYRCFLGAVGWNQRRCR